MKVFYFGTGRPDVGIVTSCPQGYFRCVSDGKCVLQRVTCNGHNDCQDRSDESKSVCGNYCYSKLILYTCKG